MVNCVPKVQNLSKKLNIKYVLVFIILVSVFSLAVYLGALFITAPSESAKPSENYDVLTLALYQSTNYMQGDFTYEFRYVTSGQNNLLLVTFEGQSESYLAVPGSSPNPFGLKVTISSANERLIVLYIAPLS
jgi:hypothetical protein